MLTEILQEEPSREFRCLRDKTCPSADPARGSDYIFLRRDPEERRAVPGAPPRVKLTAGMYGSAIGTDKGLTSADGSQVRRPVS